MQWKAQEVNFDLLLCISVQLSCNGNVMLREQRQKSTLSRWNLCSPLLMLWNLQYVWPAVQHYSCFPSLCVDEAIPGCRSFLGPTLQCSFLFCELSFHARVAHDSIATTALLRHQTSCLTKMETCQPGCGYSFVAEDPSTLFCFLYTNRHHWISNIFTWGSRSIQFQSIAI